MTVTQHLEGADRDPSARSASTMHKVQVQPGLCKTPSLRKKKSRKMSDKKCGHFQKVKFDTLALLLYLLGI